MELLTQGTILSNNHHPRIPYLIYIIKDEVVFRKKKNLTIIS